MKKFKVIEWYCEKCNWDWKTLSVTDIVEECPKCHSTQVKESKS